MERRPTRLPAPGPWLHAERADSDNALPGTVDRAANLTGAAEGVAVGVPGGPSAPRRAREAVAALLDGVIDETRRYKVVLLVSELVTNSVVHAGVDENGTVRIELLISGALLRVAVIDHGSDGAPRLRAVDRDRGGGMGLRLVDQASDKWGVEFNARTRTEVWFEVSLG